MKLEWKPGSFLDPVTSSAEEKIRSLHHPLQFSIDESMSGLKAELLWVAGCADLGLAAFNLQSHPHSIGSSWCGDGLGRDTGIDIGEPGDLAALTISRELYLGYNSWVNLGSDRF
jgi:hypothetical protein